MRLEVLTSSEELGRANYRQAMNGVYVHEELGRVLIFDENDNGFMIELPESSLSDEALLEAACLKYL